MPIFFQTPVVTVSPAEHGPGLLVLKAGVTPARAKATPFGGVRTVEVDGYAADNGGTGLRPAD